MKTIEQAAIYHSYNSLLKSDFPHDYQSEKSGFKAGVEFAQRWISIEEETPDSGRGLLLVRWLDSKGVVKYGLATYINFFSIGLSKAKYLDFIIQGSCKREVTHWRPIEYK
jgi:hypothetical protein